MLSPPTQNREERVQKCTTARKGFPQRTGVATEASPAASMLGAGHGGQQREGLGLLPHRPAAALTAERGRRGRSYPRPGRLTPRKALQGCLQPSGSPEPPALCATAPGIPAAPLPRRGPAPTTQVRPAPWLYGCNYCLRQHFRTTSLQPSLARPLFPVTYAILRPGHAQCTRSAQSRDCCSCSRVPHYFCLEAGPTQFNKATSAFVLELT